MKKILFIASMLIITAYGAFAQTKAHPPIDYFQLMNNPSNASGSATLPDTTRATGVYKFQSARINTANVDRVTIQCFGHKDSGTVSGAAWISATNDPRVVTYPAISSVAADSITFADGDNTKFWQYNIQSTVKPDFYYYQVNWNVTAKSRSDVRCYIRSIEKP